MFLRASETALYNDDLGLMTIVVHPQSYGRGRVRNISLSLSLPTSQTLCTYLYFVSDDEHSDRESEHHRHVCVFLHAVEGMSSFTTGSKAHRIFFYSSYSSSSSSSRCWRLLSKWMVPVCQPTTPMISLLVAYGSHVPRSGVACLLLPTEFC